MILTIHQPEHLPWLGFFNKMAYVDTFLLLDGVQFTKNNYQNRNKIMGTNGEQWLGVPVETKGHIHSRICDMKISNTYNAKWREKYLKTIEYAYKKHPYFKQCYPFFAELLGCEHENLCELNIAIINFFLDLLEIKPAIVRSSDLSLYGSKSDLILACCKAMRASVYVSGPSGRDYLNLSDFKDAGIEVVFNDFEHPTYPQYKRKEFTPYLSTLDLLMNVDYEEARDIVYKTKYWNK